jgi:hypothetical protein
MQQTQLQWLSALHLGCMQGLGDAACLPCMLGAVNSNLECIKQLSACHSLSYGCIYAACMSSVTSCVCRGMFICSYLRACAFQYRYIPNSLFEPLWCDRHCCVAASQSSHNLCCLALSVTARGPEVYDAARVRTALKRPAAREREAT